MTPEIVYEDEFVTLYHGDARTWMLGYADASADAVITDPPYGDTALLWDRTVDGWQEYAHHLAPQLWCFGSLRFHLGAYSAMEEAGWKYAQEIIWEKHTGSGIAADRFRRVHELAVHWYHGPWADLQHDVPLTMVYGQHASNAATRGNVKAPHLGAQAGLSRWESNGERLMRSVIQVRSEHRNAVHPTQKPLGILRPLIQYSVPKGGMVLDPFAGSGSTLIAARAMGRRAQGCELDAEHCEAAVRRLSQNTFDMEAA